MLTKSEPTEVHMRPRILSLAVLLLALPVCLPCSGHADGAPPAYNLTVELSGDGAPVGRLLLRKDSAEGLVPLGECPFDYSEEILSTLFTPLQPAQLKCSFPELPADTSVRIFALKDSHTGDLGDGNLWEASFERFEGMCSGTGNGSPDAEFYECSYKAQEGAVTDRKLSAFFKTLRKPTPAPDPVEMVPFIDRSMNRVRKKIESISLSKLARKSSIKLRFAKSPFAGMLNVKLTARYKVAGKKAAYLQPAFSNRVLAAGKLRLSLISSGTMRLNFTKQGRKVMRSSKLLKVRMSAGWIPAGEEIAAISQLQTIYLRRR